MKKIENIDEFFSKSMEEYNIVPSSEVKKKLFSSPGKLKPNQPWYFNKMFYGTALTVILFSSAIYFGFFYHTETNKTNSPNNQETKNMATSNNSKTTSPINNIDKNEENKTQNAQNKNQEKETKKPVSNDRSETKPLNSQNSLTKSTKNEALSVNQNQVQGKNVKTKENPIPENNNIKPKPATKEEKAIPVTEESNKTTMNANALAENKTETKENTVNYSIAPNAIVSFSENQSKLQLMKSRGCLLPALLVQDSLGTKSENITYFQKGLWYVEATSSLFLNNYKVTATDEEFKPAVEAKQKMLKSSTGYDAGLNIVYQQKRWIFKGGISYANYGEKLNCNMILINPHSQTQITYNGGYYEAYINSIYYDIDTTMYYHYTYTQTSHIYVTDSSLAYNTHYRPVDVTDTNNVTKFDTLPKATIHNHISYVEMPLSVGFAFPHGRFSFILSANITPGYFLSMSGLQMNTDFYPALEPYEKKTIRKFTLSAGIDMELDYRLNETWIFGFTPFCQKSLWNIYSNDYKLSQHIGSYGFRICVKKLL